MLTSLRITVPDATTPGSSSIALLADEGSATLRHLELAAGDGAAGVVGTAVPPDPTPAAALFRLALFTFWPSRFSLLASRLSPLAQP